MEGVQPGMLEAGMEEGDGGATGGTKKQTASLGRAQKTKCLTKSIMITKKHFIVIGHTQAIMTATDQVVWAL